MDGHGQQNTIARPTGRSAINVVDLANWPGVLRPWKGVRHDVAVRHYAGPLWPGYQRPFTHLYHQLSFTPAFSGSDQELGVPQGSILSVTLFSLKINSVAESIPGGVTCSMYVDDLLVCYRGKNMATIERQLQLCLDDGRGSYQGRQGDEISGLGLWH